MHVFRRQVCDKTKLVTGSINSTQKALVELWSTRENRRYNAECYFWGYHMEVVTATGIVDVPYECPGPTILITVPTSCAVTFLELTHARTFRSRRA